MARFEKGNKIGKRFSKDYQPRDNGRKPALYKIAEESYDVSKSEWFRTKQYLSQCPKYRLVEILEDEETPMWVIVQIRGLMKGAANGDTRVLEDIENRLFGKATQPIESDVNVKATVEQNMTEEEKKAEIRRIYESIKRCDE